MNAPFDPALQQASRLAEAIATACDRIAPTWPLDRWIAVNPYWGWRDQPITQASAALAVLSGARLTMPRAWFRAEWQAGRLTRAHLQAAVAQRPEGPTFETVVAALDEPEAPSLKLPLVTDLRDAAAPHQPQRWSELVTHQISQHCAAFFDEGQARWGLDRRDGLYGTWRRQIAADRGLPWRRGRRAALGAIEALPDVPLAVIDRALPALGLPPQAWTPYLSALLLSINGWASWCAHARWQARLNPGADTAADLEADARIVELLAIRVAWETLLDDDARAGLRTPEWVQAWTETDARATLVGTEQGIDWTLQTALELAWQQPLANAFVHTPQPRSAPTPAVQAVFCIDVRSEPMRRALEAADPTIATRGFAGFFGLPIDYTPVGSALTRPQLPGLLPAALHVTEEGIEAGAGRPLGQVLAQRRREHLVVHERLAELRSSAGSGFGFVESIGLMYGAKLLADSLPSTAATARWEDTGLDADAARARPRLPHDWNADEAAAVAHRVLRAMGLTRDWAPVVLLVGHGSRSTNNPQAAGLDCGACGGQPGDVNARALAELLNRPALRETLARRGVRLPASTVFVAGLHDTTTDSVTLFDADMLPREVQPALDRLTEALARASQTARAERAASLGLQAAQSRPPVLGDALRRRANDWAEVRPEWGLAGNAGLVVAPRRRTQLLRLDGRVFLHDYDWRSDEGDAVLELVMTAPMVVANWINLQYLASTVDPQRYGSGDKVLHNVVGAHIGVFEGNGGDLRTGLPLQSLHDGRTLRHVPLRLSVFIEAPRGPIDRVLARQPLPRALAAHGWLHLLRIDPDFPVVERWHEGHWVTAAEGAFDPALLDEAATEPAALAG